MSCRFPLGLKTSSKLTFHGDGVFKMSGRILRDDSSWLPNSSLNFLQTNHTTSLFSLLPPHPKESSKKDCVSYPESRQLTYDGHGGTGWISPIIFERDRPGHDLHIALSRNPQMMRCMGNGSEWG
jgi:hypothetical protein